MKRIYLVLFTITLLTGTDVAAQLSIYAGTGLPGSTGDGGAATAAQVHGLLSLAIDNANNVYFADSHKIRRIDAATGIITTVVGDGTIGYGGSGIPAAAAKLSGNPPGMEFNAAGNLFFSDYSNRRIRMLSTAGIVTTIAGTGSSGYIGDEVPATSTPLDDLWGIAIGNTGNVYVVDQDNYRIRMVDAAGIIHTVVGDGIFSVTGEGDGGPATAGRIGNFVHGIACDINGNLYIADRQARRIRKVNAAGIITTIAGSGAYGYTGDGGPATAAQLKDPEGIIADNYGNVFFVDATNDVVRRIDPSGIITTFITGLNHPQDLRMDHNGDFYITETSSSFTLIYKYKQTNVSPSFTGGSTQSLTVCQNASAAPVNTLLTISDANIGQPIVWSVVSPPAHGTLAASYSIPSSGSMVTPVGLSYTPAVGYSGPDVFVVQVSDGTAATTTTVNVTVAPLPVTGTITGSATVCQGGTTTLGGVVVGGTWSTTSPAVSVSSGGVVTGVSTGTGTISYAATNSCGSSTTTHVIAVNPLPFAGSLSGSATVCIGSSVGLTATVPGGVWVSSGPAVTVSSSGMITGLLNGTVTISYTVSNSCGNDIATHLITSSDGTIAGTITGPTSICAGTSVTMTGVTPGGAWSSSSASATITPAGVVTGVSAGTATLMYIVVSSCGTASTSQTITVVPAPFAGVITGPTSVCLGNTATIGTTGMGGTWSSTNGLVSISAGGVLTGVFLGVDTIIYAVTNSCGSSVSKRVFSIRTVPIAGVITGSAVVCTKGTVTLTNGIAGGFWSTSSPFATVSAGGVVSGVSAGNAVISYSMIDILCGTAIATHPVNVVLCNPAGVDGPVKGSQVMQVVPNPNNGSFSVHIATDKNEPVQMKLTDITGRIRATYTTTTNVAFPVTPNLPVGIYLLSATTAKGQYTARVVIN